MHDARSTRHRQRIGPALRDLRVRRGWSLEEFARRCGISESYLSQLERGRSVPSFIVLSRLASVLDVDVTYFTAVERVARELDDELGGFLETLALPRTTWGEIFELSMEARGAILDALREVVSAKLDARSSVQEAETFILKYGVEASIPVLLSTIGRAGLSAADYFRGLTQLEELPGDRLLVSNQLSVLPAAQKFDHLQVYRSTFGTDPDNPLLLKWWIRAQQSAFAENLRTSESRVIYTRTRIEQYLLTGRWENGIVVEPETVATHVRATNGLLRGPDRYHVGLAETAPIMFFVKGTAGVLVRVPDCAEGTGDDGSSRIGLRFSGPEVTRRFREYFDQLWGAIPAGHKDPEAVADWFESRLPAVEDPRRRA